MNQVVVIALLVAVAAAAEAKPGKDQIQRKPVGKCPETDGIFPTYLMDKHDRSLFYVCVGGKPIPQNCPAGLVFNPKLNVCDYPDGDCEECGPVGKCPKWDGLKLKYLRDGCNVSVFYVCVNGKPARFQCADGLVFDLALKACFQKSSSQ